MTTATEAGQAESLKVRPMIEADLTDADRIMRTAFGTFLGLPDPMAFLGDGDYVRSRWTAAPQAALTAEVDGRLVGSTFATRWGSVGFCLRGLRHHARSGPCGGRGEHRPA
ncbi:MAG: hypothetical protein JWP64_1178 [Pseudonocardia sp.]|jgi:hypothetical protein|uniref:hypothetical protein n=1 Tax=Pseudonocardia sp. TaxID=60912 RepID=UPI00260D0CE6|nr:hypothetical protein [Pseudonocardia sp.]MCU1626229.1 hypothetical protein [Pseudonocardia sp.]